jgi:hypothetical protein
MVSFQAWLEKQDYPMCVAEKARAAGRAAGPEGGPCDTFAAPRSERCGSIVDQVRMPSDPRAGI